MADDAPKKGSKSDAERTDPFVDAVRPDPGQPPQGIVVLEGLLGDSDRRGFRRLYFTRSLTYYAEFRTEDVVFTEAIPADQPPLPGLEATRVAIKSGAPLDYTRTSTAKPVDEFDLDVRLAAPRPRARAIDRPETWEAECPGPSFFGCETDVTCVCGDTVQITICRGRTCIDVCTDDTCRTLCETRCNEPTCRPTCQTCRTRCDQPTCQPTCQTCMTQCNQATCVTCQTCQTRCNQPTCHTCQTRCGQETCRTCDTRCGTCNPHVFTCGDQNTCFC